MACYLDDGSSFLSCPFLHNSNYFSDLQSPSQSLPCPSAASINQPNLGRPANERTTTVFTDGDKRRRSLGRRTIVIFVALGASSKWWEIISWKSRAGGQKHAARAEKDNLKSISNYTPHSLIQAARSPWQQPSPPPPPPPPQPQPQPPRQQPSSWWGPSPEKASLSSSPDASWLSEEKTFLHQVSGSLISNFRLCILSRSHRSGRGITASHRRSHEGGETRSGQAMIINS